MYRSVYILLLLVLFVPRALIAQIEKDKALHFGAGMVAGAAGALVASELSNGNRFWTFTGAVSAGLLAGAAKEAIDAGKTNNSWDNGDLAATALGGLTIGVTIDLFTGRKRRRGMRFSVHDPPFHGTGGFGDDLAFLSQTATPAIKTGHARGGDHF